MRRAGVRLCALCVAFGLGCGGDETLDRRLPDDRTPRGALRLNYEVKDDYGVAGAEAKFALADNSPSA